MNTEQQHKCNAHGQRQTALVLWSGFIEQKIETAKWMMRNYDNAPFWQNEINKWECIRTQLIAKGGAA
ncbi:hypothetical protein [Shewanella chilikensis]|uniref:hypothetical protein n=1 Tax=Shewanella chilikensis TaxID=558541 RepID=UPI0039995C0E